MTTATHPIDVDRATSDPLQPLDDRIIARPLPLPEIDGSVLWTPERDAGPTRAEVIAVGPGRRADSGALIPPPAEVGDVVVLAEHGPTEIEVDGEVLLCCPPLVVLAIDR